MFLKRSGDIVLYMDQYRCFNKYSSSRFKCYHV